MSANDAIDGPGNYYESAVSFAKEATQSISVNDKNGPDYKTVPTRSNAGTLFMLPMTTQRDGTLERCVYNSMAEEHFTHWFLVTSAEREAYWSGRNDELMDQLKLDASNDSSKRSARLKTQTELLPPPCVSVVTYERLGVLEWFAGTVVNHSNNSSAKQTEPGWRTMAASLRAKAAPLQTSIASQKSKGGAKELEPQNALLVIDEAHGLLPYLRTQPRLAHTLRKFGRVYHFTYNVKLVDVGYLLRTLPDKRLSDDEREYIYGDRKKNIQALPFGDDDAVYARFGKHRHFRTLSQLASQTNGKLIDFATTAVVLANVARVPGLTTVSNKWADALSPTARSSGKSRRGWLRRLRRTAKDATKASTKPVHAPPPVYTDADMDDAFRRLVAWKEKHSVRRRDTGRTRKPGRGRAHYRKQAGGTRTHRRSVSATTPRRSTTTRHRHQRGGVDVITCGVGIMLLSVLESFRPGTAQSLGGEMFNLMGKITSGFFISMGKSIRHTTHELTPYINTACQWIRRMNRYLLAHFPKSMSQFRGLATYAHRAFQFVGKRVYNIPSRYRGLTLLFVGMVGVLLMVRVIVDCLYPAGKYDGEKLFPSGDKNRACLSKFVFVLSSVNTKPNTLGHKEHLHGHPGLKRVQTTLTPGESSEALQWTMYCRKSHDPARAREGLRIGTLSHKRWGRHKNKVGGKLLECIERHKEVTNTRAAGDSNVGTGLVFTHFSDVAKILAEHDEGFTLYTASTDDTSAPHGVSTKNNNAHKEPQVWVVDEQTLLSGEIRSNMFERISHIHFLEPTSYSTKELVYLMCDNTAHYNRFVDYKTLTRCLNILNINVNIGHLKTVKQTVYEYVSVYPRLSSGDVIDTVSAIKQQEGLPVAHLWKSLKTPDQLVWDQHRSLQDDVQEWIQELGQYTFPGGTLSTPNTFTKVQRVEFSTRLQAARDYYNRRLEGALSGYSMNEDEILSQALYKAEKEKQKSLIKLLREELKESLFVDRSSS